MKRLLVFLLLPIPTMGQSYKFPNPKAPQWEEIGLKPSQAHPVCDIKIQGGYHQYYYCGHANEEQRKWEGSHTVWIFPNTYKLNKPVVDWRLIAFLATSAGAIVLDEERTQWALKHVPNAYETNPLMGRTRSQGYGVSFSLFAFQLYAMHARKKAVMLNEQTGIAKSTGIIGKLPWWTPGVANIGVHLAGAASTIRK